MPRLNGNSSHGSNPITSLSRTLSWTPHCCPQKQQWVFTSRSGSALVERRAAVVPERCGPKRSMMFSSSAGILATALPFRRRAHRQLFVPGAALREPEQRAAAFRANLLVVIGPAIHLVGEPELAFDRREIPHHHRGRVRLAAAPAERLLAARAGILVEADANLRRPLEDVEQLAEWQIQQRHDHRNRVKDRQEVVAVALHPR